jgi:hypothetical protein
MPAPLTGDEAAAAELAQLLALAATLSEDGLEGVEPVFGPQGWE